MSTAMHTWLVRPHDPLVFGTGRPFSAARGARLEGAPLPPPTTLAGMVRTRAGRDGSGRFVGEPEALRRLRVHGPLVALLSDDGEVEDWLFPAPADALLLRNTDDNALLLRRLLPLDIAGGGVEGDDPPVGMPRVLLAKPASDARPLWRWADGMQPWLVAPDDADLPAGAPPPGVPLPPVEERMHVALDPETGTALAGALFATGGHRWEVEVGGRTRRLALALRTDAGLSPGAGQAGGEGRFVAWRPCEAALPDLPDAVLEAAATGHVRVILATPGAFTAGSRPADPPFGAPAGSRVVAAAHGRARVHSGWDLAGRRPKPVRRLVPEGAVFFLSLGGTPDERRDWARRTWLAPVSDDPADRGDGLGMALIGTWDGRLAPLVNS